MVAEVEILQKKVTTPQVSVAVSLIPVHWINIYNIMAHGPHLGEVHAHNLRWLLRTDWEKKVDVDVGGSVAVYPYIAMSNLAGVLAYGGTFVP
jgi:hypothetical protein